jgi:hypothetical protein
MREKLESGTRWVRRAAAAIAAAGAAAFFAAPVRADHPGHGSHEGLLGGIYHNLFEIGLVVLLVAIVAVLVREARRREH